MTKTDLSILAIDSDPAILAHLEQRMNLLGFKCCSKVPPNLPIGQLKALRPRVAFLGPSLEWETYLKCIHKLKIINVSMPILILCNNFFLQEVSIKTPFNGIYSIRQGSEPDELLQTLERALKDKASRDYRSDFPLLIGQSQAMISIRKKIRTLSDKDVNVLITGETGSGKDLIACAIHFHSPRRKGPLVKIGCRNLPDQELERKLLGLPENAFLDVHKGGQGLSELDNGGTLFLDGIDALSRSLQEKLLQVFEQRASFRLGGTPECVPMMWILAATHSDLMKRLWENGSRVVHIKVSPLRERKDDIPWLIHYFQNKYCSELNRDVLELPDNVSNFFLSYHWPGNVRELENVVQRAVVFRDWNFVINELNIGNRCSEPRWEKETYHFGFLKD